MPLCPCPFLRYLLSLIAKRAKFCVAERCGLSLAMLPLCAAPLLGLGIRKEACDLSAKVGVPRPTHQFRLRRLCRPRPIRTANSFLARCLCVAPGGACLHLHEIEAQESARGASRAAAASLAALHPQRLYSRRAHRRTAAAQSPAAASPTSAAGTCNARAACDGSRARRVAGLHRFARAALRRAAPRDDRRAVDAQPDVGDRHRPAATVRPGAACGAARA